MHKLKTGMVGIQATRSICAICYCQPASLFSSQGFQKRKSRLKLKQSLYFSTKNSSSSFPFFDKPPSLTASHQGQLRTTFADIAPSEIKDKSLNSIVTLLSDNFSQINGGSLEPYANVIGNTNSNPFNLTIRKTIPGGFTMTYAGKRYYSTKDGLSEETSDSSSSKKDDAKDPAVDESVQGSKTQQLKRIFAVYGTFGIVFHIVMSLTSLGIMYLIVSSGIDVIGLLSKMGIELSSVAGGASTMVIAYAVHKLILPLRASITIVSVPVLVRYLRRAGYLKK